MRAKAAALEQTDRWTPRSILVLITCGIGNIVGVTTILNATFSAFLVPVSESLGWKRSAFSFVLTIVNLIGVVAYPLAGRVLDRYGARRVALVGNLLFALSVLSLAVMPANILAAYAQFAVLGLAATLPSTVLFARVVSAWFVRRRGVALALSGGLAFGIGGMITPQIAQAAVSAQGWRAGYAALGAFALLGGLPIFLLFLKEEPGGALQADSAQAAAPPLGVDPAAARRMPAFWILLGSVALGAGSVTALVTHMTPIVGERGLPASAGPAALAALYLTNAVWQLVLGWLLDRGASPKIAAGFVLLAIPGLLMLAYARDLPLVLAGALLVGIGAGTEYGLLPYCIPRYFGFRNYGVIYGWIFGGIMLVQGLAPFLFDLGYERFGTYRLPLIGLATVVGACGVALLGLPPFAGRQTRFARR